MKKFNRQQAMVIADEMLGSGIAIDMMRADDVKMVLFDVIELSEIYDLIGYKYNINELSETHIITDLLYNYYVEQDMTDYDGIIEYTKDFIKDHYDNVSTQGSMIVIYDYVRNVYIDIIELSELEKVFDLFDSSDVKMDEIYNLHYDMLKDFTYSDDINNYDPASIVFQDEHLESIADNYKEIRPYDFEIHLHNYVSVVKDNDSYYLIDMSV